MEMYFFLFHNSFSPLCNLFYLRSSQVWCQTEKKKNQTRKENISEDFPISFHELNEILFAQ